MEVRWLVLCQLQRNKKHVSTQHGDDQNIFYYIGNQQFISNQTYVGTASLIVHAKANDSYRAIFLLSQQYLQGEQFRLSSQMFEVTDRAYV